MTSEPADVRVLVGLVRVRDHCTFTWRRREGSDERTAIVHDHHCLPCVSEALRRGFELIRVDDLGGER